ncbi:hypothetical protein GF391_04445 [Candidatus Uhrbacteria bacterium]|nr:hypothetical protein [Candidatus Uhrbacteria bacterium]
MSYFIGLCVVNEIDGSQEEKEIKLKAGTDEGAKIAFNIWKKANPGNYNNAPILGEPKLYFVRRVA